MYPAGKARSGFRYTYTITKLADNQALAKVCYYGTDAAGEESYFANKHSDFQQERDLSLSIWRLLMLMAVVMRSMEPMQQDRN